MEFEHEFPSDRWWIRLSTLKQTSLDVGHWLWKLVSLAQAREQEFHDEVSDILNEQLYLPLNRTFYTQYLGSDVNIEVLLAHPVSRGQPQ